MARVITFSRTFPSYHPKKGQPTYFVEKVCKSIGMVQSSIINDFNTLVFSSTMPKGHTIRAGKRWKVGDKFSPRVWSGKPYNSKMITIAPDIEIKKVWDFKIVNGYYVLDNKEYRGILEGDHELLEIIAANDGLNRMDFVDWFDFKKTFSGQIICWNENINY